MLCRAGVPSTLPSLSIVQRQACVSSSHPGTCFAATMARGSCSCGGTYLGHGHCTNGIDGVSGRHKGPGWRRSGHQPSQHSQPVAREWQKPAQPPASDWPMQAQPPASGDPMPEARPEVSLIEEAAYADPEMRIAYASAQKVSVQKGLSAGKLVRTLDISLTQQERERIKACGATVLPGGCFARVLQPMEEAAGWIYVVLLWCFTLAHASSIGRKIWISPHHICLHDGPRTIRVGTFKATNGMPPLWSCVNEHRRDTFDGDILDCRFERTAYDEEPKSRCCDGHCACVLKDLAGRGGVPDFYMSLFRGLAHTNGQALLKIACNHATHRSVVMARLLEMLTGAEVEWFKPPRSWQCSERLAADELLDIVQDALLAQHRGASLSPQMGSRDV